MELLKITNSRRDAVVALAKRFNLKDSVYSDIDELGNNDFLLLGLI